MKQIGAIETYIEEGRPIMRFTIEINGQKFGLEAQGDPDDRRHVVSMLQLVAGMLKNGEMARCE